MVRQVINTGRRVFITRRLPPAAPKNLLKIIMQENNVNNPKHNNFSFWHTLSVAKALDKLATNAATGLSQKEAAARLLQYGPNQLTASVRTSGLTLFFRQFKNSLIVILLAATALSGILGHAVEAIAIGVIILFSVILGFIQELRAGRAMEALSKLAAPTALIFRNGLEVEILAQELVPGDIMIVSA